MMSYSVIKSASGKLGIFDRESEVVIEMDKYDEKEIRSICRKMNLGSGFNGWTPEFLAKTFKACG
jgi:hypothetical protein